jgi:hypothetical protein
MGALTDEDPRRCAPPPRVAAAFTAAFFRRSRMEAREHGAGRALRDAGKVQLRRRPLRRDVGLAHLRAHLPESVRRAGFDGDPIAQGEALFEAIFTSRDGVVSASTTTRDLAARRDRRRQVHLAVPELLGELAALRDGRAARSRLPVRARAGERRTNTANTIFRDPVAPEDGTARSGSAPRTRRIGVTTAVSRA